MTAMYDIAVIGTGAIGSAAFFHAARSGRRVIALEQFDAAHDRGSSHGQTRIIRLAYFEHPDYVPLLREAYRLWKELEQITNRKLYCETGLLEVGFPDGPVIQGILRSAREHELQVEQLSQQAFTERYPAFRKWANQVALFEREAGYLLVEACVQAHIDAAIASGGDFRPQTNILSMDAGDGRVTLNTSQGNIVARQAILATGSWTSRLLPLPAKTLRVVRKHQYWIAPRDPQLQQAAGCPTFFFETPQGYFYGFPAMEPWGLKVARHTGGDEVFDPTNVVREIAPEDWEYVRQFLSMYLGQATDRPARYSVCMYTMSPDEHFIVDRHPQWKQIVFCAGLSGHGFKFAPTLGRRLVTMLDGEPDSRFEFLRLSRLATAADLSSAS